MMRTQRFLLTTIILTVGCTADPDGTERLGLHSENAEQIVASAPVMSAPEATEEPQMPDSSENVPVKYNPLNDRESYVILQKGTEPKFQGEYTDLKDPGTYICRRCNAPLYLATHKFHSDCGWPSFDDEIKGAVERHDDNSLFPPRIEITCKNCGGHLGHVFDGEGYTDKNTRHCVNSISMKFIAEGKPLPPVIQAE